MITLPEVSVSRSDIGVLAGIGCLFYFAKKYVDRRKRNPRRLPLPPGPKGLPIVGNLFQLPLDEPWVGYTRMSKDFGDMMYLEALGQPILILSSVDRVNDVLEKRSATYSNRPVLPVFEMMDVNWSFSFMQYDQDWRNHRQAFHRLLSPAALPNSHPILNEEIPAFLRSLHNKPDAFLEHIKQLLGLSMMRIAYGFDDLAVNQQLLHDGGEIIQTLAEAIVPGQMLVNDLPILRHVPAWFPGAGFRRTCDKISQTSKRLVFKSFERAYKDTLDGKRGQMRSMADDFIESMPEKDSPGRAEYERIARDTCAIVYTAGSDTTFSSMTALLLALATSPEVQRKAQKELDAVVGLGRLPTLGDQDSLPYITAIVKEGLRWFNTAPLGFAHVTSKDDEYDGYFIPKGTYVMGNTWAISHDESLYKDPFVFNPDRFMKDGKIDPSAPDTTSMAFGFGRRICPGRFLGLNTLWLSTACILQTFDLSPPKDSSGNRVNLKLETTPHMISTPLPFELDIRARSPMHVKLFSAA